MKKEEKYIIERMLSLIEDIANQADCHIGTFSAIGKLKHQLQMMQEEQ